MTGASVPGDAVAEPPSRQAGTVRGHLAAFTAALAAPILLLCGFMFWQVAQTERTGLENDASEASRSIAAAIDRELSGLFASIDLLSLSANLQTRNLQNFHEQIRELAERQGLVTILSDRQSGQQLANARVPWGNPLPRSNTPLDAAALAGGRPYVTDLFRGAVSGGYFFAVVTPVFVGGSAEYVITLALEPERLRRLIEEAEVPARAVVSVVDRRGVIMARNVRQEEFIGREATRDLLQSTTGRRGSWTGTTIDGTPIFGVYARSSLSDFRVAVGLRQADLDAPVWSYLSLVAGLGLAIAALSTLLGLVLAGRIIRPIRDLANRAAMLGRGEPVQAVATGLREADTVGAELAAASTALRSREAELLDASEEIQRFAYIVSHDLRSPLVNIMGFTSELEALRDESIRRIEALRAQAADPGNPAQDHRLNEDFAEAIGFIKAAIGKMDRLINAILKLSREGRREFRPERLDMDALLANIIASVSHQAETAGASVAISGSLPPLISDRVAVEQVFSNLVDNALKYLRHGVPGRIEISGRDTASGLVYEVRDNGRGIDPKDRDRVFELFRRSGVQDKPGEGIGLAHVRALVRRLGGSISLTSTPGQGSVFAVTLPRRWSAETLRMVV